MTGKLLVSRSCRRTVLPNKQNSDCVAKMNGTMEQTRPRVAGSSARADWTDEKLLLEYRRTRDKLAFQELVRRYERELYGYLRHYLGDDEDAADVFQQTFLAVHLKCSQFEPGRMVRPWLYAVATNQAIDFQRRNRKFKNTSLDRHTLTESGEANRALSALLDSPQPSPDVQAQAAEEELLVRRAIDELPDDARQLILLVYFQGLKYREAAEVLGIPVGTVKSRLHAAIQKLHDMLSRPRS